MAYNYNSTQLFSTSLVDLSTTDFAEGRVGITTEMINMEKYPERRHRLFTAQNLPYIVVGIMFCCCIVMCSIWHFISKHQKNKQNVHVVWEIKRITAHKQNLPSHTQSDVGSVIQEIQDSEIEIEIDEGDCNNAHIKKHVNNEGGEQEHLCHNEALGDSVAALRSNKRTCDSSGLLFSTQGNENMNIMPDEFVVNGNDETKGYLNKGILNEHNLDNDEFIVQSDSPKVTIDSDF